MIDDVLALLIELAENATPQVMEAALDRHHIDDPELRSALLNKDSQALMRFLGPEAPSPNNSSVYSVQGSSGMSPDGSDTELKLDAPINILLANKNDGKQYQVTGGSLSVQPIVS